jgi:hypothetical protein
MSIQASEEIAKLNDLVALCNRRLGQPARSFQALVAAGYFRALPRDPSGRPYTLDADGRVKLNPRSAVDLSLLQ